MTFQEAYKKAKEGQRVYTSTMNIMKKASRLDTETNMTIREMLSDKWEIEKTLKTGWINLVRGSFTGDTIVECKVYKSEKAAKQGKSNTHIATIKIEWEE